MKKNQIISVVAIAILAVQGCTVTINPATGVSGAQTHAPVVPDIGIRGADGSGESTQGTEGEEGVHEAEYPAGAESRPVQLMGKGTSLAQPVPTRAVPQSEAWKARPDSAFGAKFWAGVLADSVIPVIVPAIVGQLIK